MRRGFCTLVLFINPRRACAARVTVRPVPIILFFLPIILFRISQNILLLFLRIGPIILNYSHKNSGKLNGFNDYCNVSQVSNIVFSLRLPRAIVSDTAVADLAGVRGVQMHPPFTSLTRI